MIAWRAELVSMGFSPIVLLVSLIICSTALADGGVQRAGTVAIMTAVEDETGMEELRSVLEAYLTDLEVKVVLIRTETAPAKLADQIALSRRAAAREKLLSVIWLERAAGEFIIFVADEGGGYGAGADPAPRGGGMGCGLRRDLGDREIGAPTVAAGERDRRGGASGQ